MMLVEMQPQSGWANRAGREGADTGRFILASLHLPPVIVLGWALLC